MECQDLTLTIVRSTATTKPAAASRTASRGNPEFRTVPVFMARRSALIALHLTTLQYTGNSIHIHIIKVFNEQEVLIYISNGTLARANFIGKRQSRRIYIFNEYLSITVLRFWSCVYSLSYNNGRSTKRGI